MIMLVSLCRAHHSCPQGSYCLLFEGQNHQDGAQALLTQSALYDLKLADPRNSAQPIPVYNASII